MRKIIVIVSIILLFVTPICMGKVGGILLLNGVSATGASSHIEFDASRSLGIPSRHVVSCYYTDANASISAVVIALQASNDPPGTADASLHWDTIASHTFTAGEITAKQAAFWVSDAPASRIRVNITTLTGVGAGVDAVYVMYRYEK